jgi:hypothetical protein
MKHTYLPYHISEPPVRLKKAKLDNIALVPASLLPLKGTYQSVANSYPTGSVLYVPGTIKQKKIVATITQFFRDHGRQVITLPLEKITSTMKKTPLPNTENLPLAF